MSPFMDEREGERGKDPGVAVGGRQKEGASGRECESEIDKLGGIHIAALCIHAATSLEVFCCFDILICVKG